MAQPATDNRQAIDAIYAQTAAHIQKGVSYEDIAAALVQQGLDPESAALVIRQVADARREAGLRNAKVGAAWCIGGGLVTAITFASASGGGTYVVAWGAILFGAVQGFRGLAASGAPPPPESYDLPDTLLDNVAIALPVNEEDPPPKTEPSSSARPTPSYATPIALPPRKRLSMRAKVIIAAIAVYAILRVYWVVMNEGL